MKKLNFKISVRVFTLCVAITTLLLFLSIHFFIQNQRLKKNIHTTKSEKTTYEEEITMLKNKSVADELFIEGRFDSALVKYKEINADTDLIKSRKQIIQQIEESKDNLVRLEDESAKLQSELTTDQKYYKNQADSFKHLFLNTEVTKDSLLKEMSAILSLLGSKQKELDMIARYEKLVFYSSNRIKITYLGETKNGKANGYGLGYYSSGSLYEGSWKDNMRNGKGSFQWIDGDRYEGDYVSDNRSGTGTYYWKNGEKYKGKWENNMRNGYGILYDKDDKVKLKGIWKDDLLVKSEI